MVWRGERVMTFDHGERTRTEESRCSSSSLAMAVSRLERASRTACEVVMQNAEIATAETAMATIVSTRAKPDRSRQKVREPGATTEVWPFTDPPKANRMPA